MKDEVIRRQAHVHTDHVAVGLELYTRWDGLLELLVLTASMAEVGLMKALPWIVDCSEQILRCGRGSQ